MATAGAVHKSLLPTEMMLLISQSYLQVAEMVATMVLDLATTSTAHQSAMVIKVRV